MLYSRNQIIRLSKKTVFGFRHFIFSNGCTTYIYRSIVITTDVKTVTSTLTNEIKLSNLKNVSLKYLIKDKKKWKNFSLKKKKLFFFYQCSSVYCTTSNGIQNAKKTI